MTTHYSQSPESPSSTVQQTFDPSESQDSSRETGEEGEGESDRSALPAEDASVLTNGLLSEEEEAVLSGSEGVLPVSALEQAGVTAEALLSSLSRRSSLPSKELVFASPLVQNAVSESPSSGVEVETDMSASFTPGPHGSSEQPPPAGEPVGTTCFEGEGRSTLSKQDRLLIHKIRRYYEHAEHQDANFSIKRRESLSYIPAGLVRNLSRQLNSGPQGHGVPAHRRGLSRNRPTSWSVFDLPGLGKSPNTPTHQFPELKSSPVDTKTRLQKTSEEAFRPSADMLEVWNDMEMEEQEVQQISEETCDASRWTVADTDSELWQIRTSEEPTLLQESENWPASKESSVCSKITSFPALQEESPQGSKTQETNHFSPAHLPKIVTFRKCTEEEQIFEDMGRMRNKVFQLARQYSQRIKNNRPLVWQRNRGTAIQLSFKNAPAVQEKAGQHLSDPTITVQTIFLSWSHVDNCCSFVFSVYLSRQTQPETAPQPV